MDCKKNTLLLPLAVLMLFVTGCAGLQQPYLPAPSHISGITRDMSRPGFWISRHSRPDDIIMGREAIEKFNLHVEKDLEFTRSIRALKPIYDGRALSSSLEKRLVKHKLKHLFFKDGGPVGNLFYHDMARQMNINNIPDEIVIRYAVVTTYANQRVFPTSQGLYSHPKKLEFDRLQNSALDLSTVVAVLHDTADGRWQYVLSPLSGGWVETEKLALCSRDQARGIEEPDSFVVVTGAKADIYLDPNLTLYQDHVRMGTRLCLGQVAGDVVQVNIPGRNPDGTLRVFKGYMRAKNVWKGFLPYTPRNIINQAFEGLNTPYGWGGMYGEQDCSRFINAVFATVGLRLPRNSSAQAKVGLTLGSFNQQTAPIEKLQIIKKAGVGSTLFHLNGHIMLYLGDVDGQPYVIHSLWAYGGAGRNERQIMVVNGVKVTPLSLGTGSMRGSLLDRLKTIPSITMP